MTKRPINLPLWRKRHGNLTQARLADALKMSVRQIGRWEATGKYPRWLAASLAALPVAVTRKGGR